MKKKEKIYAVPASLLKRFLAFFIDLILIEFLFVAPFQKIFTKLIPNKPYLETVEYLSKSANFQIMSEVMFLVFILTVTYFILTEYKLGQSLGKLIMNIHIISEQKELSLWQILVSNLVMVPFFPFVLLWVIDPIYLIFSPNRQRLLEKLARLKVVELHAL